MEQFMLNGLLRKVFSEDSKEGSKTIRDTAVEALYYVITDYSDWYDEQGLYLPPDYASNPSEWCEVLHQMKRAFKLLFQELHNEGELWEAKKLIYPDINGKYIGQTTKEVEKLEKEIQEGLALFGKYLYFLTDEIKDRGPAHG